MARLVERFDVTFWCWGEQYLVGGADEVSTETNFRLLSQRSVKGSADSQGDGATRATLQRGSLGKLARQCIAVSAVERVGCGASSSSSAAMKGEQEESVDQHATSVLGTAIGAAAGELGPTIVAC